MLKSAYASPNKMVWEYLDLLHRIGGNLHSISDENERRQNIALCIILAVTVVGTFLNIFFRVKVSEKEFAKHKEYLLKSLKNRWSLEKKLKEWPKTILNANFNLQSGIGKRFSKLKDKRNGLMHFTTSHETLNLDGAEIHGVSDISSYHDLRDSDAYEAIATTEDFIQNILELSGLKGSALSGRMLHWTGKTPV